MSCQHHGFKLRIRPAFLCACCACHMSHTMSCTHSSERQQYTARLLCAVREMPSLLAIASLTGRLLSLTLCSHTKPPLDVHAPVHVSMFDVSAVHQHGPTVCWHAWHSLHSTGRIPLAVHARSLACFRPPNRSDSCTHIRSYMADNILQTSVPHLSLCAPQEDTGEQTQCTQQGTPHEATHARHTGMCECTTRGNRDACCISVDRTRTRNMHHDRSASYICKALRRHLCHGCLAAKLEAFDSLACM